MRDGGTLYFLLGIYFAVNAALRLALPGSLEMEESRLLFSAQWLAPGYVGHAPLAVWLQHGAAWLLGANSLAVIVLENLLLFASYLVAGWAAFLVIRNRALAIISVLGMLLLPQIAYEMQRDAGASAAMLLASGFFVATLFAMLHRGSLLAYALFGLGIGVGILSSYDFILLLSAALIAILLEPAFRARLVNWRIIATVIFAGAALAPHVLWLRDSFDFVLAETIERLVHSAPADRNSQIIEGLFSLAAAVIGFVLPTILVFWLSFGRRFHEAWQASSPWTRLLSRIFLLVLLAFIALVVLGGAPVIHDRWLVPVFFMLPLYFSLKLDALNQTIGNAPKRFGAVVLMVMIAVPLVLAARVPAAHWTGHYTDINLPYRPAIETILASGSHPPCLILAENPELAGNLRLGAKGIAIVTPGYASFEKGYPFDESHPLLVVWRAGAEEGAPMPEPLARLLAFQVEAGAVTPVPETIALPYHFGRAGDAYRFGYAWVYPPAKPAEQE